MRSSARQIACLWVLLGPVASGGACPGGADGAASGRPWAKVQIDAPGRTLVERDGPWPTARPVGRASVELWLPPDAPRDLHVVLFLADKDGVWFQASGEQGLGRGVWQTVTFDLRPSCGCVEPRGHEAVWNDYYAARVARAGLQLFSAQSWRGEVRVGGLRLTPAGNEGRRLRVVRLRALTAAPRSYEVFELAFDIQGVFANPLDPDAVRVDAEVTMPDGRRLLVPAFYHQPYRRVLDAGRAERVVPSGRACWRVRYTPLAPGHHTWKLMVQTPKGRLETGEHPLDVAAGRPRGFVRRSRRDPRYFETADGAFFYPIGLNIHAPFDVRCAQMLGTPVPPNRGTFAYDDYFAKMSRAGQNAVVVWMCNWWLSIEWTRQWRGFHGLADYHLGNAWRLDCLLDAAARHGIFVHLVLDNHGKLSTWVDSEWETNPYNAKLGGPCDSPEAFFTSPAAFRLYSKRLRYIVARWSSHPSLLGYELISELNLVGSSRRFKGHPSHASWCRRACAYLARTDPYQRPVGVQYSNDYGSVDPQVASLPSLDFLVGDVYKPGGTIVPLMVKTAEMNGRFGKPTFSAEFGGNWNGTTPARLHADLHAGLWSNAMTTTAGAPFFWWFDFVDRYGLYREHQALARFMAGEDRRGLRLRTQTPPVTKAGQATDELGAVALVGARRAWFWAYDTLAAEIMPEERFARRHGGAEALIGGLAPGRYDIEYWDTSRGAVTHRAAAVAAPEGLRLSLPDFTIDIAAKIRAAEEERP